MKQLTTRQRAKKQAQQIPHAAASAFGRLGGLSRSPAKLKAGRKNIQIATAARMALRKKTKALT